MAAPIIAALRHRTDLKESILHTAQELAHLASIYGVVQASYTYLAWKSQIPPDSYETKTPLYQPGRKKAP